MGTTRATTVHGATLGTAIRMGVRFTLAAIATVTTTCAASVLSQAWVSATVPSQRSQSTVAAPPAKLSDWVATPAPTALVHRTIDLFGDSLGYQAAPYLGTFFTEAGNFTVSNHTFGGTATCDWLSTMAAAAAAHPQVAVLVFSGNALTPCMDGLAVRSLQYYDRYTSDTEQAIALFSAVRAHVFLVGTPIDQSSVAGWDRLDDIYRRLAQDNPHAVTYVDAGAAVESPSGRFTWQLPCMSIEPSCGTNGTNTMRSPDGVHFCPDGTPAISGVVGPCDEYSPGAFRFALAIVSAVTGPATAPTLRSQLTVRVLHKARYVANAPYGTSGLPVSRAMSGGFEWLTSPNPRKLPNSAATPAFPAMAAHPEHSVAWSR